MRNLTAFFIIGMIGVMCSTIAFPSVIVASDTRGLTVVAKDKSTGRNGEVKLYNKSYAVVIGIDSYQNLPRDKQLKYAVKDARGVQDVLSKNYRFDKIYELYNEQATRDRIMELLTIELPEKMGEEDSLFIFWAGHGNQEKTKSGDIGYLIPHDGNPEKPFSNISMTLLKEDISKKLPAKHVFYVMDACYGGLLTATRSLDKKTTRDLSYLKEITKEQVRQVLTAGGKKETVLDRGRNGHSVFTGRLIEVLENSGDFVTANEIQAIIKERVYKDAQARSHTQTPAFGTLYGNGDYVFVPNAADHAVDNSEEIARLEREKVRLEAAEAEARKSNDNKKRRKAEEERKATEAKLKAEQLKKDRFADEERRRADDDAEQRKLQQLKSEDEKKVAALKAEVERKRKGLEQVEKTDTLQAAVAEIRRLNGRISEIEATFERELSQTRKKVNERYTQKLTSLDRQKRDEFEDEQTFRQRITKERGNLTSARDSELASLETGAAAAAETQLLRDEIRKLSEKEFTLGAESLVVDLGQYDIDKKLFPISIMNKPQIVAAKSAATGKKKKKGEKTHEVVQPKEEFVKIAMNGIIPLPPDAARNFKQQWQAGALRPQITIKVANGEILKSLLVNDAENTVMIKERDEFITIGELNRRAAVEKKKIEQEKKYDELEKKTGFRFSDETALDKKTGLMWALRGDIGGIMTWDNAMSYANNVNLGGFNNWRLPTREELRTLQEYGLSKGFSKPGAYLNNIGFINIAIDNYFTSSYWSSREHTGTPNYAWYVSFNSNADPHYFPKDNKKHILPVRNAR